MDSGLYIGVDGYRHGWIACVLDHGDHRVERFDDIGSVIAKYPAFDAFLIDMVVGLRTSPGQLRPDGLARRELKFRASTVFPVPCRQAVYAETEDEMKQANISVLGKSLAKQTINIIPKIREIDEFMGSHPEYRNRLLESHPELDFARLNGAVVMSRKKEQQGFEERRHILGKYLPDAFLSDARNQAKAMKCNPDDVIDAICLAVTAALSAQGLCETIPGEPETDDTGLLMKLTVPSSGLTGN